MLSFITLLICFHASLSFVIRIDSKSRIPALRLSSLINTGYQKGFLRSLSFREYCLKASPNSIEKSTKKRPPVIIRFLRNVATLVLGNLLLFISFPFKFISRIIFGNKPKTTTLPEPVISKTVKAVAVSPDLQVEEAYIKKQESNAYKKKSDSIAFAKKTIEKKLKALDMSKKAISKPASAVIAPTMTTVSPPIVTESPATNLSPIEIVNDIKDKVESALDEVESFISGIKTNSDDEPAKGLVVSRLPIREAETGTEAGSEIVTDEVTTVSVESATAVVTKLYAEAVEVEEETLVTQQLEIEAAPITTDIIAVEIPIVESVEVEAGPYDIYSVTVPDFRLVKSQVMQSLSEQLASFEKAWKESVTSLESPNTSPGFADVMNVLAVKMDKEA